MHCTNTNGVVCNLCELFITHKLNRDGNIIVSSRQRNSCQTEKSLLPHPTLPHFSAGRSHITVNGYSEDTFGRASG